MTSIKDIFRLINETKNILIGAGSGLSAAGGMLYTDKPFFDKHFPGYSERYGLGYTYEAAFHNFPTLVEQYTYWARHIKEMRIDFPVGAVYTRLLELLKDKNHFVISTNVDGQFEKAGFDKEKLFTPQGDYSFFQCSRHCCDQLYSNKEWCDQMLDGIKDTDFAGHKDHIPFCPNCGELLAVNIRKDSFFVEKPWMAKQEDYASFIDSTKGEELVLLELGVGFNTPTIIRLPFEKLAADRKNISLIRVNQDNTQLFLKEAEMNYLSVQQPIEKFLMEL
ncbi:Sir2 silent information regulator family NAD-dependent deacetylase [Oceanispirochaeta crateris]|uniref:Sir2 silent information regulator family NAD-dependent deacetylase n=1 Tax=Oceanispirochaeta crateris TaxID=2518645 RepID=A0A5C1QNW3_9SPIO|nr:Sir2 silent information regulator family NAD-dependent deacetylase [Oceanispirochaeta crateris]QEN08244.1 Sir2 silent information regulator family NAD-dependent deacetylase [Oceanispirochaeta crateris]